jgi:hypothetical protein
MKIVVTLISFVFFSFAKAQLVVDIADFAGNPSKYNGRYIVLRGVEVSKTSGSTLSLGGPRTTNATSPTSGLTPAGGAISGGTAVAPSTAQIATATINATGGNATTTISGTPSTSSRVSPCAPPRNWELLTVHIPNYQACFVIYSKMASNIPSGRKVNTDLTIFVDTNLMHRIARVKIN